MDYLRHPSRVLPPNEGTRRYRGRLLNSDLQTITLSKVSTRLIPFLSVLYIAAFIDRVAVGFAAAQMTRDLGFSAYVFGLGAGILFVGYCIFEVPSNLIHP
jgi:MFS transporter, ACS family, tartrate transporter